MTTLSQPQTASNGKPLIARALSPAIGATVEGVDLSAPHSDGVIAQIRQALDEHLVLFFEDQHITPVQQRDFAKRFGELHVHPLYPGTDEVREIAVLAYDENRKGHNNTWHTDVTFIETPPQASILFAEEIPEVGGDTIWVNSYAAYEALSEPLKKLASELRAVHDFSKAFKPERFRAYGIEERAAAAYAENPPVSHPVVRTNLATGRKALFVNATFASYIEGLSQLESDALLKLFFDHLVRPEFQVRWRWKPNTVAFWDNRWTQHYALSDYFPHPRRVRRATILGDRPV
jgi:taurine dioxygenase